MDNYKRNTLRGIAIAGATGTLQGCALLDNLWRREVETNINCDNGSYPLVDAHAHFFNGSDLLAGPYLTGPVIQDEFDYSNIRLIRLVMKLIGKVVQRIATNLSITASRELVYLRNNYNNTNNKMLKGEMEFSHQELEYRATSQAFFDSLTDAEKFELQREIALFDQQKNAVYSASGNKSVQDAFEPVILDQDTLYKAITGELDPVPAQHKSEKSRILIAAKLLELDVLFSFALRMLTKRSTNLAEYQHTYSKNRTGPFVLNVTDITVDFDYWLGGCENDYSSSHRQQVQLHEELSKISNGYTVPLLGVNPMKLIHEGKTYCDFVDQTLERGIYRGIKIYPTHGFSPNGELHSKYQQSFNNCGFNESLNQDKVRSALYELYEIALERKAVVMAHSDRSKGMPADAATFAGPQYWKKVLNNNTFKDLKVNFGHLGEFRVQEGTDWTSEFLKLMSEGPRYGDVGFWFTKNSKNQLKRLLREAKNVAGSDVYDKILFGSDWFMLTSKPDWKPYADRAYRYFDELKKTELFDSEIEGQNAMNKFFYLNAQVLYSKSIKQC